jgi:hypothetical protein
MSKRRGSGADSPENTPATMAFLFGTGIPGFDSDSSNAGFALNAATIAVNSSRTAWGFAAVSMMARA